MPQSGIRTHDSSAAEVQTLRNVDRVSIETGGWTSRNKALRSSEEILYHESRSRPKGKYYGILDTAISFYISAINIQWPAAGRLARVQFRVSKFSTFPGHSPSTNETTNQITTRYWLLKLLSQYTRLYPPSEAFSCILQMGAPCLGVRGVISHGLRMLRRYFRT